MTEPVWVRSSAAPAPTARAMPKSATLTWPELLIRTFPGLTSRWITPRWWAKSSAAATSAPIEAARAASSGASRSSEDRVRPSTYSMTMK